MTFAEIQQTDPMRYNRLEQKARERGLITANQSLVDLSTNNPDNQWLEAWAIETLEGRYISPGQYLTGLNMAADMDRLREVAPSPTPCGREVIFAQPTSARVNPEQQQLAAGIAGYADEIREVGKGNVPADSPAGQLVAILNQERDKRNPPHQNRLVANVVTRKIYIEKDTLEEPTV